MGHLNYSPGFAFLGGTSGGDSPTPPAETDSIELTYARYSTNTPLTDFYYPDGTVSVINGVTAKIQYSKNSDMSNPNVTNNMDISLLVSNMNTRSFYASIGTTGSNWYMQITMLDGSSAVVATSNILKMTMV